MEDGALRFQMLQAVREYALEQLVASGETRQIQRQHASYYLQWRSRLNHLLPPRTIALDKTHREGT